MALLEQFDEITFSSNFSKSGMNDQQKKTIMESMMKVSEEILNGAYLGYPPWRVKNFEPVNDILGIYKSADL